MVYGYVRVSTLKQNTERQRQNILEKYPDAIIYEDVHTRTDFSNRENWEKLLEIVTGGDTIVFDSVSRMSGNTKEGIDTYEDLYDKNIELVFLNEPHINTSVYKEALNNQITLTGTITDIILEAINKYLKELAKQQIIIAFNQAEKEVLDLRKRTIGGLETARRAGRVGGRPKVPKNIQKKMYMMYYCGDYSVDETVSECGISRATLYNYLSYWGKHPKEVPVTDREIFGEEYDTKATPGRPSVPKEIVDEIQEVYENTEWSFNDLADFYNLSKSTIKKYCTGIQKRKRKGAKKNE